MAWWEERRAAVKPGRAQRPQHAVRVPTPFVPLPDFYPTLLAKISSRLVDDPAHPGCLIWPKGHRHARIKLEGKLYSPHRVVLECALGRLLPAGRNGTFSCHRCDNPPCCNVDHLFAGTRADNSRDAYQKGRAGIPLKLGGGSFKYVKRAKAVR